MLTEYSHDFGEVNKGDMPEYRFEIKNIYQEPINIAQVFSSCGCTQVSVSKRQLKSWETAEIICRFNSKPFNGFKQATVTVRFGQPMVGEVQLTVKGTIVNAVRVNPESIDFGQVSRGKNPVFNTTITGPANSPFQIIDIKSTFPHVGVSLQQPVRTASNQIQYTMQTRLKDSAPDGYSQGDLFIVVQDGTSRRQIPLKFSTRVASAIKLSPSVITLNNVEPGEKIKKTVVIRADEPFKITDVKCRTKAFRVSAKKSGMSKTHIVDVSYTGEEGKTGKHECELTFYTTLGDEPAGKIKAIVEFSSDEVSVDDSEPLLISDR
ncbi:DUF1573 domain-containing protein [Mariniblastus fucicola]|nr:DUF1573 domain-containing protein [Mariniblastus fucicola]